MSSESVLRRSGARDFQSQAAGRLMLLFTTRRNGWKEERWMEEDQRDTGGGGGRPKTVCNPEPGNLLFVLSHYCRSWHERWSAGNHVYIGRNLAL